MDSGPEPVENGSVAWEDCQAVLDHKQLNDITLDDATLMRSLLCALIEGTSAQLTALRNAIDAGNGEDCRRLAHCAKGACANLGAAAAAAVFASLERTAESGDFSHCRVSLKHLEFELERLRNAAATL
jgi:HPt (histidine-containing phosphotransfer) domain-containing protein